MLKSRNNSTNVGNLHTHNSQCTSILQQMKSKKIFQYYKTFRQHKSICIVIITDSHFL